MEGSTITLLALFLIIVGVLVVFLFSKPMGPPHPVIENLKSQIAIINPKFRKIPMREGKSSYTENKAIIYLCLKHPKKNEIYNMNTLMYVALHEVAHVISENYGHGEEWQRNFQDLLDKAVALGLYDPSRPVPKDYCGMKDDDG